MLVLFADLQLTPKQRAAIVGYNVTVQLQPALSGLWALQSTCHAALYRCGQVPVNADRRG